MDKIITRDWLKQHGACSRGMDWLNEILPNRKSMNWKRAVNFALDNNHFNYANWLIAELLPESKRPYYGLNAAKLCEHVYNEEYPNDTWVHDLNVMTERYLKGEVTLDELERAYSAAYRARYSAAYWAARVAAGDAMSFAARFAAWYEARFAAVFAVEADPTIARAVIDYGIKLIKEANDD